MSDYSSDFIGQRQQRIQNLQKLRELGIDPFPAHSKKDYLNKHILNNYNDFEGKNVSLAGRLMNIRDHGKLIFGDLRDRSGDIQIAIKKDDLQENGPKGFLSWEQLKLIDPGDILQMVGSINKTQQGEITLFVKHARLLAKSLRPYPHNAEDKELQFRRRYVDLVVNPNQIELFKRKSKFWKVSRDFLQQNGFIEIEVPILEFVTGGADARPFITYHNALDQNFFLRISTELYQKRLIGGGMEKIYTLGPNFRNEGIDDEHLPEYYQLEWYWAYADYRDNMNFVKELFRYIAKEVYGKTKFSTRGHTFDLSHDWKEIDYTTAIKEKFNIDIFSSTEEEMLKVIKENGVELHGAINRNRLIDNLWKLIRKTVSGPAFLVNQPKFLSPLAKAHPDNEKLTERFQVIIAGSELGNGYTEINDPMDQLDRFLDQQKLRESGDEEAQMLDIDYVEMLEYGMPPTSGYGQSERIFWFLEDVTAREGTLFPQLRHEVDDLTKKIYQDKVNLTKSIFNDLNRPDLFSIHQSAAEKWPSINVGFAIIRNVNIEKVNDDLENEKKETYSQLEKLTNEEIGQFPEIQSYRKMYKEMGVDWHSRRPSPEALLRRLAQGKGLYSINACVDAYNLIVMRNRVSVGAFDLDNVEFPTILRLAKEGEEILLLGDSEPTKFRDTEIAYFDGKGAFNIDFNYRDAQRTAVTMDTKNIMINVDGVHDISRHTVEKTLKETIDIITKYCGGEIEVAGIVSAPSSSRT